MVTETLKEIEEIISTFKELSSEERAQMVVLTQELSKDLDKLSQTHKKEVTQLINNLGLISGELSGPSIGDYVAEVQLIISKFESTHPVFIERMEKVIRFLTNLGV